MSNLVGSSGFKDWKGVGMAADSAMKRSENTGHWYHPDGDTAPPHPVLRPAKPTLRDYIDAPTNFDMEEI